MNVLVACNRWPKFIAHTQTTFSCFELCMTQVQVKYYLLTSDINHTSTRSVMGLQGLNNNHKKTKNTNLYTGICTHFSQGL